jgi:hypothetical protein
LEERDKELKEIGALLKKIALSVVVTEPSHLLLEISAGPMATSLPGVTLARVETIPIPVINRRPTRTKRWVYIKRIRNDW